jgi:tetratricopeptide (TPR) repeat protein
MNDEPTEEEARALAALIGRGVAEAMRTEDFEQLRALVTREAPAAIPRLTAESENAPGRRAVVNAITTSLWNVAPLPSNGYRPRPLPAPGRNDPCPCGSGRKFKRCCGTVSPGFPALPEESTWQVIVEHLTADELERFVNDPALPPQPLALLAAEMRARDLSDAARTALSRRLGRLETLDDRFEAALSVLFDLESDARPIGDFVAWANDLAERLPRRLKAVAYRQLVPAAVTAREIGVAKALLDRIRAVSPDDPSLAPLEVITLLTAGEHARASERARFWLAWLRRHGLDEEMPEAVELLEHTTRDPEGAAREFREVELPFAGELAKLVSAACARPPRPYGLEVFEEDAVFARRPRGVRDAERAWSGVWPRRKPHLVSLAAELPESLAEDPEPWLDVLRKHPEAFDSIEVLDDLVLLAGPAADDLDPTWDEALLGPILERAAAIVRASVVRAGQGLRVPWTFLENRPALRLLSRLGYRLDEHGRADEAAAVYEEVLDLNPSDNHGHRSWLVDHYLRRGDDARALALADKYPDDAFVETRFGRGLALWRLGRRAEAEAALTAAAADRPLVVAALLAGEMTPPEIQPDRVMIGGDDEAWLYRESMRETWLATPDALEYLRGLPAAAPGRGKRRKRSR